MFDEQPARYAPGDHWMICDTCGFKYRRSKMRKQHDNLWVCGECFDPQHPQEFVRGRTDKVRVDVARPESVSGDITIVSPDTVGDGWTDNGDGTYTSDGTETLTSRVTWSVTPDEDAYYEVAIRVTDGGATGLVKAFCGYAATDEITTGYAIKYGLPIDADRPVGFSQRLNWTGTVTVKIRKAITRDNL